MTMGQKIRELRKAKSMTQICLASKIGVTQTSITLWETDKFEPSLFTCIALADFFGVSLDELCCREFNPGGNHV